MNDRETDTDIDDAETDKQRHRDRLTAIDKQTDKQTDTETVR